MILAQQTPQTTTSYCLRGEIDGQERTFPLQPGTNVLGTSRACEAVLSTRGVSRRHARLVVGDDKLRIVDLSSKNGTWIGDARVADETLRVGDLLRLGPQALRLEELDPDDGRLGLELDLATASPEASMGYETSLLDEVPGLGMAHLQLIRRVVDYLTLPEPDLAAAVERVRSGLGASGAALVEEQRDGLPVVIASAGSLGAVSRIKALGRLRRDAGDADVHTYHQAGVAAALHRPRRGPTLGFWLWAGEGSEAKVLRPLLVILLHLAQRLAGAAIEPREAELTTPASGETPELTFPDGVLPGHSPEMVGLYQQMQSVAADDVPVLLLGETGVGKEHLARTLHLSSERSDRGFVVINCAAIPAELLEAELFGIGRGVATGVEARKGKFQQASGGTLFLDEVGDMPLPLQAKLLRALEEGKIYPVGRPPVTVDVRLVGATNTDLRQRIREGSFRSDLYYRLAGFELEVPPLRRRVEDLPPLVGLFLRRFTASSGKRVTGISVKALRALTAHPWPGNVRELEHEVRRLVHRTPSGQAIDSTRLSPGVATGGELESPPDLDGRGLRERMDSLEESLIRSALAQSGGNQTRAAELLQVSRGSLIKRMKRLAINPKSVR